MKKVIVHFCLLFMLFQLQALAQKPIDEGKVNKAVTLMQKMMSDPGQMQNVMTELEALKLNSAENKEAKNRLQQQALSNADKMKKEVMEKGGISEQQISNFKENKDRIVPLRDEKRINAVLKRDLSDAEIKIFCKAVHEAVKNEMNPVALTQAESIYTKLKAKHTTPSALGNGAIVCYLYNLTQQSIYIMGKVCSENTSDANNLNNYASLLTSYGAEHGAIPILNYLNRRYANSPVIMSNLSVAWLGLGDMKTAEKYADSCIRFFPGHAAQAHYVKAVVKESEGDRESAVEELKQSLAESYSAEKAAMLKKMGGKLNSSDFKKTLPADALGLSKFNFPSLPKNYEAAINSTTQWKVFYSNLESSIKELEIKTERLKKEYDAKTEADAKAAINFAANKSGKFMYAFALNNNKTDDSWHNYFQVLQDEFVQKEKAFMKEARKITEENSRMLDELDTIIKVHLDKRFEQDALGKKFTDAEACNAYKEAYDNYMLPANNMFEKYHTNYIDHKRRMTNELVYAGKQFMDKEYYEYYASNSKLQFLYSLQSVSFEMPNYALGLPYAQACINTKENPFKNTLSRFEDPSCAEEWEMSFPGGHELSTKCNTLTFKVDLQFVEVTQTEDLFTGEWTNRTFEFGVDISSKKFLGGAGKKVFEAGVEGGAFIQVENDKSGNSSWKVSDYGVKGKAGVSGTTGTKDTKGSTTTLIEAEGKVSLKTGKHSFETKVLNKAVIKYEDGTWK